MSTIIRLKPKVELDVELKHLVDAETEKCTIIHCRLYAKENSLVRIWPETFLVQENGKRLRMVKAMNISLMPHWTFREIINGCIRFTLVFEGLDKDCNSFSLLEDIPEPNGFYSKKVLRNYSDVYQVKLHSSGI